MQKKKKSKEKMNKEIFPFFSFQKEVFSKQKKNAALFYHFCMALTQLSMLRKFFLSRLIVFEIQKFFFFSDTGRQK